MSMNQETGVGDQMSLMIHMYPSDQYIQTSQQHKGNIDSSVPVVTRRRRRKTSKSGDGAGKRKLSSVQVVELERSFENEHKLESERKDRLAKELGLDPRQVAVWFQNRRARWKTKKLEEEYSSLKSLYDESLLHTSRLQSQVVRLTDQLKDAEREIQRLGERIEIGSTHSPSSSQSIEVNAEPSFFGDFVVAQDYDDAPGLYAGPNMEYLPNMEWMMGGIYM